MKTIIMAATLVIAIAVPAWCGTDFCERDYNYAYQLSYKTATEICKSWADDPVALAHLAKLSMGKGPCYARGMNEGFSAGVKDRVDRNVRSKIQQKHPSTTKRSENDPDSPGQRLLRREAEDLLKSLGSH